MSRIRTVAVCYPQVPFFGGGTERLAAGLRYELEQRGYEADLVSVPFRWYPREEIGRQCLAWRLLDLSESNGKRIDLVIATKFPSYLIRHERKVTWLVHQFRQVYELRGTPFSEFGRAPEDEAVCDMVRRVDHQSLRESRSLFAISHTVADRLRRYNDLEATPLHPPPRRREAFRSGDTLPYVLAVGRLEAAKRFAPLVEAMRFTDRSLRCVIVGRGPEEEALRAAARAAGVEDRVEFRGELPFDEIVALYADCLAVYFAPYQEDYGLVTVEAFLSQKPVVTAPDAGGPLEFVEDGVTGLVVEARAEAVGDALQKLAADPQRAAELGRAGHERVRDITWDAVVEALLRP